MSAIEENIARVLPELQKEFGEELTRRDVVDTITPGVLLGNSMNASMSLSISSVRGERVTVREDYLGIVGLYREALELKENPPYLGGKI